MYKVIYDKSSQTMTTDPSSCNTAPTLAEIKAIEELMSLLEEGGIEDDYPSSTDDVGIVVPGVCFPPPPTSFKPKSQTFSTFSTNPNIWAFVEQMTNAIKDLDLSNLHSSNLSLAHRKAIKTLQNHPGLIIKPADKGRNIVVMDVLWHMRPCAATFLTTKTGIDPFPGYLLITLPRNTMN